MTRRSGLGPAPLPREPPGFPDAARGDHPDRLHEIVDMRVVGGVMPSGAGHDPATQGGELERLRKMAQRVPVRLQLRLQGRAQNARLDARRARRFIDLQYPVQPRQIDRHDAVVALGWIHAVDHGRSSSVGDRRVPVVGAPFENGGDLRLAAWVGDEVRGVAKVALESAQLVGVGASVGMGGAVVLVVGADRGEGVRCLDPGRSDIHAIDGGQRRRVDHGAVLLRHPLGFRLPVGLARLFGIPTPRPKCSAAPSFPSRLLSPYRARRPTRRILTAAG